MFKLEFEVEGLPKMTNSFKRSHWIHTHKERTKWKKLVRHAVENQIKPAQPLNSAVLTLVRVSSAEPDFDGLVSGFKPVVDGLVECGVLATDKVSCVGQPAYRWEKGKKGQGKIKVKVESMAEDQHEPYLTEKLKLEAGK